MIVKLFDSSKANISEHISHIFDDEEPDKNSTVRKFRIVRKEGSRNVSKKLEYYNCNITISNSLYKIPIIDASALFALTLLIAESKPEEMDVMKQIVISVLNK